VAVVGSEVGDDSALVGGDVFRLRERFIGEKAWISFRGEVIWERTSPLQAELNDCGQGKDDAKGEGEGTDKKLGAGQTKVHRILLCVG
jgi:hypothetical protein